MKQTIRLTEGDLHRIVKESVNRILKESYGKGEKYTYKTEDGGAANCEFVTATFEDGYPYSVGLIDHNKKEIYPNHGYHYPNRCAKGLMKKALSLGYTYVDSEMPSEKNKTLLKKYYKSGRKEGIFLGQIKEIRPAMGVLERYEIVDIIWQKQEREPGATWYISYVAMKKVK